MPEAPKEGLSDLVIFCHLLSIYLKGESSSKSNRQLSLRYFVYSSIIGNLFSLSIVGPDNNCQEKPQAFMSGLRLEHKLQGRSEMTLRTPVTLLPKSV